ncbi:MAG TPA: NAD-binding protein [Caulobacterales bacterium]|nr:NAD-binding protein [Caulobacterales bacterium]
MRRYGNLWSRIAARFTTIAHVRAPVFRWVVLLLLVIAWIGAGLPYWLSRASFSDAVYSTLGAISLPDSNFEANDPRKELMRYAALAVSVVGLLFAFSGQLGRSLAQAFTLGAANHIVICGGTPPAISLALDCDEHGDSVILIAKDLADETAEILRRRGVIVLEGDATRHDILKTARVRHAAHVVAFEADDGLNLEIEAAARVLVGEHRRRDPLDVHVATHTPMLLREARAMRAREMTREKSVAIDAKPFSLDEMAARLVIQTEAQTLLDLAAQLKQQRLHLVFFGFCRSGEAVAVRALMSLWSAHFEPVRITVLTPDAARIEKRLRAHYPEAFAHPELWAADITFQEFDWEIEATDAALLDRIAAARGPATAVFVTTDLDTRNIQLALSLKRACNLGYRWPVPIYMAEQSRSEFSQQYARGDETPDVLDAYLKAFGSHQTLATKRYVLEGWLDRGAAVAHEAYSHNLKPGALSMRELQASMKDWSDVLETYRAANRAVADSAMVKVWDAGWRPASDKEKGDTAPQLPGAMMEAMAKTEHNRWMAERLLSGWRPAEKRDNEMLAHDKLAPWSAMSAEDRAKDETQVRAAVDIARMLAPKGFVGR